MSLSPRISVNIPTWRRRDLLRNLLIALRDQELPPQDYEVLVCDSGSDDGTAEMVHDLLGTMTNLRYLNISINTLSAKRNALALASRAPLLLLLDDDVIPASGFLAAHLGAHDGKQGIVACGAIRFPDDWVATSNYFRFRDSRHLGHTRPDVDTSRLRGQYWTVMNMSLRRADAERLGLMDEAFVRYGGEDHEFAARWERAGMRAEFVATALVWHYEAKATIDQFERKQYFAARYGFGRLLALYPEYLSESPLRFLEAPSGRQSLGAHIREIAIRFCFNPAFAFVARRWLELTDTKRWAYIPGLFRYLAARAYMKGARDRLCPQGPGQWFD